jgi:hypothetical protein
MIKLIILLISILFAILFSFNYFNYEALEPKHVHFNPKRSERHFSKLSDSHTDKIGKTF